MSTEKQRTSGRLRKLGDSFDETERRTVTAKESRILIRVYGIKKHVTENI